MGIDPDLIFLGASKSEEHTFLSTGFPLLSIVTSKGDMLFLHRFESAWAFKKSKLACTHLHEAQIKDTFEALHVIQLE